jgi:hypothetical protein
MTLGLIYVVYGDRVYLNVDRYSRVASAVCNRESILSMSIYSS